MDKLKNNLVIFMSDEHSRKVVGSYGKKIIKTPTLDRLSKNGVQFNKAYTNCPICVPARASFATGQYVHQHEYWDNAQPYDGVVPSWGHYLKNKGHYCTAIGKLHYRSNEDDNGFDEEIIPMHVLNKVGDLMGLLRDLPIRKGALNLGEQIGPGKSTYIDYDISIRNEAIKWIKNNAKLHKKPWVLFVSFACPHFPLIAPKEFYDLYDNAPIKMPILYDKKVRPNHRFLTEMRKSLPYDDSFNAERVIKAINSYYGLVSFVDDNIKKILNEIDNQIDLKNTNIIYTSDHGDNLGARGLWSKSTMYEESAGIPLLFSGPGISKNKISNTPVSLIDIHPTILQSFGYKPLTRKDGCEYYGKSLYDFIKSEEKERLVFSEYHSAGTTVASYMIRKDRYKYIKYVDMNPMFFDLLNDKKEIVDLSNSREYSEIINDFDILLRRRVNPEEVDNKAKSSQNQKVLLNGGRDFIVKQGDFGYSPIPGQIPSFN